MPQHVLGNQEIWEVLASEMIVRVAFSDRDFPYVIPFGFVYVNSALYGITAPGRKTRVADRNCHVGFQVDSSSRSGPWEWRSVTGEGLFEIVEAEDERTEALTALEPLIAGAPGWWQDEIRPLVVGGIVKVWKISPTGITGVEHAKP